MTPLDKPVSRRCRYPHRHYRKRLVATLVPGDVLELRHERSRKIESIPLSACYDIAVKIRVNAERAEKVRKKKKT